MKISISRRRFLAAASTLAAGTAVPAIEWQDDRIEITRHRVPVPGLPRPLDGMRIAQVSDLHLYDGIHATAQQVLHILDEERPDLLVLTGDQWDEHRGSEVLPEWLTSTPSGLETVAVLGNHEYWAGLGVADARRCHERAGAELLVNQAATHGVKGAALTLVGLDDLRAGNPDLTAALGEALPGVPQVWLIHEPAQVDLAQWPESTRPALILSGHTHGGQIRLPGLPPVLPRGAGGYLAGWYQTAAGPMYVSRGVGSIGIRTRFRCPPEVPVFTLEVA